MNIERQIAELLNKNNELDKEYTEKHIRYGKTKYLFIHKDGQLWGAVGVQRIRYLYTIVKHLVVAPDHRGKGMATALMEMALNETNTPFALSTVRKDNETSLHLLGNFEFEKAGAYFKDKHLVILLVKSLHKEELCQE